MSYITKTAVLVVAFQRHDYIARVLGPIRAAQPARLYLAFDAARPDRPGESECCAQTAALTVKLVDWPCEIFINQAAQNMGGDLRVSSAIDWIFRHEERAIIIEEDCLAHQTFFRFCDELLDRYADDERIAMISGDQFVPDGWPGDGASYAFVRLAQIWGWATWRRAWKNFDYQMKAWPKERKDGALLRRTFARRRDQTYWRKNFDDIRDPGCWDYRWCFTRWHHQQAAIAPAVNLCANIGFGPRAMHTTQLNHPAANVPLVPMTFPLRHPATFALDDTLDAETTRILFSTGSLLFRLNCHWQRRRTLIFPA